MCNLRNSFRVAGERDFATQGSLALLGNLGLRSGTASRFFDLASKVKFFQVANQNVLLASWAERG